MVEVSVVDEVVEPVDDQHIRIKENEFSLKPGSSGMLLSNEMATPGVDNYPENPIDLYSDNLDSKNLDRIGSSEHAGASPRCMDDAGVMVEELTLRNYDGEKLTIVGTSNNRERMKATRNQWQHFYQIAGGSVLSSLHGQMGYKDKGLGTSSAWEHGGNDLFSGLLDQNQPLQHNSHNTIMETLSSNEDKGISSGMLHSSGGIRTKILSKSGFSEYFVKNSLGGKGVIHKNPPFRGSRIVSGGQDYLKSGVTDLTPSIAPLSLTSHLISPRSRDISEPCNALGSNHTGDGITLREWLESGRNKADKVEALRIFRQILDLVDISHSHRVPLQDLRPSCLKLSGSHQIVYIGSSVLFWAMENVTDQDIHQSGSNRKEKRPTHKSKVPLNSHSVKKRKLGGSMDFIQRWPQFPSRSGTRSVSKNVSQPDNIEPLDLVNDVDEEHYPRTESVNQSNSSSHNVPSLSHPLQASVSAMLEEKWYSSPELCNEKTCTFASNIYCLGVLLFELLGSFDSGRSHAAAMQDLRQRILPPSFLMENQKGAVFCLWLLHPDPSLRPTTREILQSNFVSGIHELSGGQLLSIDEEDGESELLLYFLTSLDEQKQKDATNLVEQIQSIEADILEVEKRRPRKSQVQSFSSQKSRNASGSDQGTPNVYVLSNISNVNDMETRLSSNSRQLESAYFSVRSNIHTSDSSAVTRRNDELLKSREKWCSGGEEEGNCRNPDYLGNFFDGFCKYARYSKFRVRGILRNGEFNNSANVICSLSFDRDEDYLAAGGVSKKIKVFEFQALFNDSVDIHYPVVEMTNRSKLSCICWNNYIRNYLASTDYDGIVKLWDASTGQGFSQFIEHSERAWSVDFSRVDPTKLASGSDDRLVKLWSINEKNSLCTIRNSANVCSVQFSSHSTHLLAFSSADYKTYCYDLRNTSTPWCILAGHEKAVSYAKFLDSSTLVSASTDNTLKIWDLNKTSSNSISRDACALTLRGHTNEKNFVGLSVADGYITCGSETNEVFAYYKSLPMPIAAHKFGSIDVITGKETEDDNGQFVSSICWRQKSNMVVAANSSGCIKLLQMV